MTIRIDPAVPIVWRTPHLVQLGVDDPICVLPATSETERILAALVTGVPPGALEVVAESAGAGPGLLEEVMNAVAPALLPATAASPAATSAAAREPAPLVAIDGTAAAGTAVNGLHPLLGALGMRTTSADVAKLPDAVVLPASFVVSPGRFIGWLSGDVPHLPVVFGDRFVEVGPLVEPGAGPCLRCVSLHHRDADTAWPVISVQLEGAAAATMRPLPVAMAVARAARMLDDLLNRRDHRWATRSIRIEAVSGDLSVREHLPHPECGCRALPGNVTALRRRTAARDDEPSSTTVGAGHG